MRAIEFEEVGMENYGPYIDPMILTFPKDKLMLITGPNGIGKTMALDAIPFTLYGITSKGAKGDDVVNNQVGKNCKTWVKFKVYDNIEDEKRYNQYIVTRYHKYTKYQNTVIVTLNDVDIKQGQREVLPYIERVVCPQQAFMNSLMFGQKVKDFFTDLVDSKKKEIFRKLLDLEMFLIYYKGSDNKLKELKDQSSDLRNQKDVTTSLLNNAIANITALKHQENKFYEEQQQTIKEKEKELGNSIRLLSKWQKDLKELSQQDIDLETTIIELTNVNKKIASICEESQKELKSLETAALAKKMELDSKAKDAKSEVNERTNDELSKLQEKRADIKQESALVIDALKDEKHKLDLERNSCMSTMESLSSRISEIQTHVLDCEVSECPLCEQHVDENTIKTLENKITDYQSEHTFSQTKIDEIKKEIQLIHEKMSKEANETREKLKIVESDERSWKFAKQDKLNDIDSRLQDAILKVNESMILEKQVIIDEIDSKTKDLVEQENQLKERRAIQEENIKAVKTAEETITKLTYEQNQIEKDIQQLTETEYDKTQLNMEISREQSKRKELSEIKNQLVEFDKLIDVVSFWKTGFSSSGIPSMLIDEAIPYMNERVEHYLDMFTNGRYVVSFDTLDETKSGEFRDKISVRVLDTQTRANTRVQLSGGQTRIIDIAIILTLGDLLSRIQNVSFNILLFDEIFDALDEQNIQYVSQVLSKIKLGKAIYIISHQHQDHLEADETLAFS